MIVSVRNSEMICLSFAPTAFMRPISLERSMTPAVTRFAMARAEAMSARTVTRTMSSWVFSRIVPSDSATWRTGRATESVMTSSIW